MKNRLILFFIVLLTAAAFFCFYIINFKHKTVIGTRLFTDNKSRENIIAVIKDFAYYKKQNPLLKMSKRNICFSKNYDEEIKRFKNFLLKIPSFDNISKAEIFYNIANLYYLKQDYDKSFKFYKKALKTAPYYVNAKYNIKVLVDFDDKTNSIENLIKYKSEKIWQELNSFLCGKEKNLNIKIRSVTNYLKNHIYESINLNKEIISLDLQNAEKLQKEINSLIKENNVIEYDKKSLEKILSTCVYETVEDAEGENIYTLQKKKKMLLKNLIKEKEYFDKELDFWHKIDNEILRKTDKFENSVNSKTPAEKYFNENFETDSCNLQIPFKTNNIKDIVNTVKLKKRNILESFADRAKDYLNTGAKNDYKILNLINERIRRINEEKENIKVLLNDVDAKEREINTFLKNNSNAQKNKNLQKSLLRIQEKQKALRQEFSDCNNDITELKNMIQENSILNRMFLSDIKKDMSEKNINVYVNIKKNGDYIRKCCNEQIPLLNKKQELMKNIKSSLITDLFNYSKQILRYNERIFNASAMQAAFFYLADDTVEKYKDILNNLKYVNENINTENKNIFEKENLFINNELKNIKTLNLLKDYKKFSEKIQRLLFLNKKIQTEEKKLKELFENLDYITKFIPKKEKDKTVEKRKKSEKENFPYVEFYEDNDYIMQKYFNKKYEQVKKEIEKMRKKP